MTEPQSPPPPKPLRLRIDGEALAANWRTWARLSGPAACGAAIKADGYGLGAREVMARLAAAGCRDFFVATWAEAAALGDWPEGARVSVLHGVSEADMAHARAARARPVLNSAEQVARWRETGRACDVMVDTGMNRLGLSAAQASSGLLDRVEIDTLHSHLACADEPGHSLNERQLSASRALFAAIPGPRRSLSNSAGVLLGTDYHFDLTRPGLALYGGLPREDARDDVRSVVRVEAQVVQRRTVQAGEPVGYSGTFVADRPTELAIVNLGYADGYLRAFSGRGRALLPGGIGEVVGRVSMDLTAIRVDRSPELAEGDWLELDFDLAHASAQSGLSQYELLTSLGARHARSWY